MNLPRKSVRTSGIFFVRNSQTKRLALETLPMPGMSKKSKKQNLPLQMQKLSATLRKANFSFDPVMEEGKEYLLFDASPRLMLLRFVALLSILCPAGVIYLVSRMTTESMISEAGSVTGGRWLQAGLLLLSCIFLVPMLWLSGKYVRTIIRKNDGAVEIIAWRLLLPDRKHIFYQTDFEQPPVYHEGRTAIPLRPVVHAPYHVIRPRGKKMIIDGQGKFPMGEDRALEAVNG